MISINADRNEFFIRLYYLLILILNTKRVQTLLRLVFSLGYRQVAFFPNKQEWVHAL